MSNFTPLVERTYEFEGDSVKIIFSRLRRKDMLAAMPAFKKMVDAGEDAELKSSAINDVLNIIAEVLPEYVQVVEGLKDSEGNDIGIKTIADEMYFMGLCAKIATDIMGESSVPGGNV